MRPNRIFNFLLSAFSLILSAMWSSGGKKRQKKAALPFPPACPLHTHCGVSQARGERSRADFHLSQKKWKKGESFFHVLQEAAAGTTQRCPQHQQLRPVAASSPHFQPGHQQHPAQPGPPPMGSLFPSLPQYIPVSAAALGPAQGASLWEKEGMQQDKPKSIATAASAPC